MNGYAQAVHERSGAWPKRVAITNGEWLVVFTNPQNAFAGGGGRDSRYVRVILSLLAVDQTASSVWQFLSYQLLLDEVECFTPASLIFSITGRDIDRVLHGLRVVTGTKAGERKIEPTIYVQPVLFMRTRSGGWIRVLEEGEEHEHEIPHDARLLIEHFRAVDRAAKVLLASVNHQLRSAFQPSSVESHYADTSSFQSLKGFSRREQGEVEVITGTHTHYLLEQPRVRECLFHEWGCSQQIGQHATESAILKRSIEPKSFFYSGEQHHCSHRVTLRVKGEPLSRTNASRCGVRSGEEGEAFCEVYPIDHHLCCQACVLHGVCQRAEVFRLPCHESPGGILPTQPVEALG